MHELHLPPQLRSGSFLPFLHQMAGCEHYSQVAIDFKVLQSISPAPLAALTATIHRWRYSKMVVLKNLSLCPIGPYLQRMDFLKRCGVEAEENFVRHPPKGRFVPLMLVDHPVDSVAAAMADCLAPGGGDYEHELADLWEFAYYVITEMGNNVRQHSRGAGYAAAQFTAGDNMIRLAIADAGNGILKSFQDAEFTDSERMSHGEAISMALKPRVSSKGTPINQGVGLTLVSKLTELTGGWLAIMSGNGLMTIRRGQPPVLADASSFYQGTIVAFALNRSKIHGYAELLEKAKIEVGLQQEWKIRVRFE